MRSKIWILAASVAAAMGCGTAAHAACPSAFTVKDSTGSTQNVAGINDARQQLRVPERDHRRRRCREPCRGQGR